MKWLIVILLAIMFLTFCTTTKHSRQLVHPTVVQGLLCKNAEFYETGELKSCELAKDDTLSGNLFPAGTRVILTREGWMEGCTFPHDTQIQGYLCSTKAKFYENGLLRSCELANDDTLSGNPLPAGTSINFAPEGWMRACGLPHHAQIQGHLCYGGFDHGNVFYPNGKLKRIQLAQMEYIQGIPCMEFKWTRWVWDFLFGKGDPRVRFWPNGKLQQCRLAKDFTIEGRSFNKGDDVRFDREGRLI